MPTTSLKKTIDPEFPDYVYAAKSLVKAYSSRNANKTSAHLFLGEWMKILDKNVPAKGRVHVRYRGGEGYVDPGDLSRNRHLEIFFIDVGQGDGILIQTPDDRRILIDAGQTAAAHEFIRNKYRLDKPDNCIDFDAVIATHSDVDHSQGLIRVLEDEKIAVKRFFHNGLFPRSGPEKKTSLGIRKGDRVYRLDERPDITAKPPLSSVMKKLHGALKKAERNLPEVVEQMKNNGRRVDVPEKGFVCRRLDASERYLPLFDKTNESLKIEVLWPRAVVREGKHSYSWYGDVGKTVNGNSVVLRVLHGRQRILLAGDLNSVSMDDLMKAYPSPPGKPSPLEADVYKAAHHGSQDFSVPFLKAVRPNAAVISSGDDAQDKHGHPRGVLLGTITRYSRCEKPAVFVTELAACFSPLSKKEQARFKTGKVQLYERSIQGIVHLRSNGEHLCLGTVHGRKAPDDPLANVLWKWDYWPQDQDRETGAGKGFQKQAAARVRPVEDPARLFPSRG